MLSQKSIFAPGEPVAGEKKVKAERLFLHVPVSRSLKYILFVVEAKPLYYGKQYSNEPGIKFDYWVWMYTKNMKNIKICDSSLFRIAVAVHSGFDVIVWLYATLVRPD